MINKLHLAMIELYSNDAKRIQHFCKVHSYAKLIAVDLCQYFEHKKLKGYADFFNSSSSFCCGVI